MQPAAALAVCLAPFLLHAATPCPCDVKDPETLKQRQCSLNVLAEERPLEPRVFFVPDANPRKPNRLLALPREQSPGMQRIADLDPVTRVELWREAIAIAKSKWGDGWGVAYNGDNVRTQCHVHIHIGRLIEGVEFGPFEVVDGPEQIRTPGTEGIWIHAAGAHMHVHTGEQITETVLLR